VSDTTEVTELLNLWGETVERCARRMLAGAQHGMIPAELPLDELGTPRELAKQHAEKIASMARESLRAGAEPLPGQLDPAFYTRVAEYLARDV
jgi:hypothetical protein